MKQFAKGSIEFLTVAVEFCRFIENPLSDKNDFLSKLSKLLFIIENFKYAIIPPIIKTFASLLIKLYSFEIAKSNKMVASLLNFALNSSNLRYLLSICL